MKEGLESSSSERNKSHYPCPTVSVALPHTEMQLQIFVPCPPLMPGCGGERKGVVKNKGELIRTHKFGSTCLKVRNLGHLCIFVRINAS